MAITIIHPKQLGTGTRDGTRFLRDDGTWQSPGASSTNIKQTEVDFGTVPIKNKKFTITDGDVSAANQILVGVSYDNPTGGVDDDAEWFEDLIVMARAGTGQFFVYCNSPYNDLDGKVKLNYLIG